MHSRALRLVLPLALIVVIGASGAMAAMAAMRSSRATVMTVRSAKFGPVLVTAGRRTLYRFTPDRKGLSTCKGTCAKFWPPLLLKSASKPKAGAGVKASLLGTISHSRGVVQVTYAGFPLYLFADDHKAGQVNGEGFQGKWFVVSPRGALVKKAVATSAGATVGAGGNAGGSGSGGSGSGGSGSGSAWG